MQTDGQLIAALQQALELTPDNVPIRKHLGELLVKSQMYEAAEKHLREVLTHVPDDESAQMTLAEAFMGQAKWYAALVILEAFMKNPAASGQVYVLAAQCYQAINQTDKAAQAYGQAMLRDATISDPHLEARLQQGSPVAAPAAPPAPIPVPVEVVADTSVGELERSLIRFADVGGMEALKEEIRLKIIHPLNNAALYKSYGKTIGGGILMYGPPGCGKTHLARATAGEVQAFFLSIGIHDVLNMYIGQSENNLHELFQMARRNKPCVIFIDEVDALGASRADMRQSAGRHVINQFLSEMDGASASNDGVLVLAATNAPWHVDSALRRPGRFDQVIFVPPPDRGARAAILKVQLREKPTREIDYEQVAKATDGFSGADLKAVVDRAVEDKLREALRQGTPVPLVTADLLKAAKDVKPSTQEWFATARNYTIYANQGGAYDEVAAYLKNQGNSGFFSRFNLRRDE